MGKSTQYRNWAVTWKADTDILAVSTRDGVGLSSGGYDFVVFVGPKESPDAECSSDHQHVLVHCSSSAISKKKAKEVLVEYSSLATEVIEEKVIYISKIWSTVTNYMIYIYKMSGNSVSATHKDDDIVKSIITDLKEDGVVPTHQGIKRKLIDDFGANAFNKRFGKIAETYLAETDVIDSRGNPKVVMAKVDNRTNFLIQMLYFYMLLMCTTVSTSCKPFGHIPGHILRDITFLMSLLPYFTKRVLGTCDNLPGLYLFGMQGAGKSSMFNNCRYIKKVPTDSAGVSRYRLDKMHTCILLDDIEADHINQRDNSSTLKQLTLGNDTEVKTMGSTQSIKSWVVITSNSKPTYLSDVTFGDDLNKTVEEVNSDIVKKSWRRRFISIEFTKPCPYDSLPIAYDDLMLRDMAAQMFRNKYIKMMSDLPDIYSHILKPFEIYYNIAVDDYASEDQDDYFETLLDSAMSSVNDTIAQLSMDGLMNVGLSKSGGTVSCIDEK